MSVLEQAAAVPPRRRATGEVRPPITPSAAPLRARRRLAPGADRTRRAGGPLLI